MGKLFVLASTALLPTTTRSATASPAPWPQSAPAADYAWQNVLRAVPPEPAAKVGGADAGPERPAVRTSLPGATAARAEARTRYTQASDSARAFYNLYPTHPHAAAARKLEAIAALRGAPSDAAGKARALGVARAYRQDRNQPATDRFQVALLMERVSAAVSPGRSAAHRSSQATRDQERLVDSLRTEFGDLPDVYALYADLIADAEPTESARLARKVLALPATDAAKAAANSALARQRLIGRSLAIDLRTTGGQAIRLSTPPGKPTVIYFSDPKETFFRDERGTKMPTRWIHVALGAPAGTARSAPPGLNDSVLHCVEPAGLAARICQVLHVREYPFTVVLDAQGKVRDYGRGLNAVELLASQTP